MAYDLKDIAQAIRVELGQEEISLAEAQRQVQILTERVNANRAWLQAHGFTLAPREDSQSAESSQAPKGIPESTVKGAAVSLIKLNGPMTITQLHEMIVAAGKNVSRVTVDQAVRDDRVFDLTKKDGRVVVSVK